MYNYGQKTKSYYIYLFCSCWKFTFLLLLLNSKNFKSHDLLLIFFSLVNIYLFFIYGIVVIIDAVKL